MTGNLKIKSSQTLQRRKFKIIQNCTVENYQVRELPPTDRPNYQGRKYGCHKIYPSNILVISVGPIDVGTKDEVKGPQVPGGAFRLQVIYYEVHHRCSRFTSVYSPKVKVRFSMEVPLKERHDTQFCEGKYKYRARVSMLLRPQKLLQKSNFIKLSAFDAAKVPKCHKIL